MKPFDALRDALAHHASLSLIGLCKNAGKTTVLNRLLALPECEARLPALTSIGRDGERVDVATGTDKPGVWVRAGMLVATAADLLRHCDVTREILATTGMATPLGEVVIFRALSAGQVQIAGPSMTAQLRTLTAMLRGAGAGLVLIDGAAGRKTLGAPTVAEAAILCAGASCHPELETVVAEAAHVCRLWALPVAVGEKPGRRRIAGAVTQATLEALSLQKGDEIICPDASHILLTPAQYGRWLARGVGFAVEQPGKICCVCVNPFSAYGAGFEAGAFRRRMSEAVGVPVVDVNQEGAMP
ncbi:MAG: hypothetical protein LBN04_06725 [Oscillospiraceae bacterium]|jgi:hypothetical protein|nr:hypothetical protein [Oscillospiraceae bacterium]